jgi:hypothetical protein
VRFSVQPTERLRAILIFRAFWLASDRDPWVWGCRHPEDPRPLTVPMVPKTSDNPTPVGLLGAPGVMAESQDLADLLPQRRLRIRDDSLLGAMDAGGGFWL